MTRDTNLTHAFRKTAATLATGTLLATSGSAEAQEARQGTAFGDWLLACEAVGVNRTSCVIRQTLTRRDGGALIADVILRRLEAEDDPRIALVLVTPTGMFLPEAPGMAIDAGGETLPLQWRSCDAQRCVASRVLTEDDVASLSGGGRMSLGYRPVNRDEPVIFSVSLDGVTAGLAALEG